MIRFAPHRLTADCHRRPLLWLLAAVLCVLSGCGGEFIQKEHGRRRGRSGLSSVNGTAVLADMFREQGHKIDSRRGLTPTTQSKADVIVMTADEPVPDQETRAWLEDWLWAKKNRTLIYVGRDYDAAPGYYQRVIPGAPADQKKELELRQQIAKNEFAELRETIPAREDCNWFTIIGANSARKQHCGDVNCRRWRARAVMQDAFAGARAFDKMTAVEKYTCEFQLGPERLQTLMK